MTVRNIASICNMVSISPLVCMCVCVFAAIDLPAASVFVVMFTGESPPPPPPPCAPGPGEPVRSLLTGWSVHLGAQTGLRPKTFMSSADLTLCVCRDDTVGHLHLCHRCECGAAAETLASSLCFRLGTNNVKMPAV